MNMNWADVAVIGIISLLALIGFYRGFVKSIFKIISFFAAIIVSIKFYPEVAKFLEATPLYNSVWSFINDGIVERQRIISDSLATAGDSAMKQTLNSLSLPSFLNNFIISKIPEQNNLVDLAKVSDLLTDQITKIVVDLSALLLIYIAIRIILFLLRFVLEGIAKLPVFKQIDKLGGLIMGAVEGLLTIYILMAILMLFHTTPNFDQIFEIVNSSNIAKYFYENNFIITIMFPL
jgi:uncharacterized membrane protein required for colicin V production